MNGIFAGFGMLGWKPVLTALILPPVPLLVLLVAGLALRAARRPLIGLLLIVLALAGLWISHVRVVGDWIERRWIKPPPVLQVDQLPALRRELVGRKAVVVVLGNGRDVYAAEYGEPMLKEASLQRLHYGLWLARRLDLPVAFSGGAADGQRPETTEAAIAARIAERDYGRPLRWQETQSTDTRGNARHTVPLVASQGVTDIVLVTHGYHMPRAMRAFEEAIEAGGLRIRLRPAPMGSPVTGDGPLRGWLPSADGHRRVWENLRELIGWIAGA